MQQHIVIIGGGLGGLFTGAFLSKEGYKVTVLEKHHTIGGGLHCFKRFGEIFETGMHIIGGFQEGGNMNRICKYLGILGKLHIRPTDADAIDSITYLSDNKTYFIPRTKEKLIRYLSDEFPEEKDNIGRYVGAMYNLANEVDLFYLRPGTDYFFSHSEEFMMPADEFVNKYIKNPRLRDLVSYMNLMYGGIPGHTPAFVHALINVLYIDGSSQFEDGSQQLADALCDVIISAGNRVLPNEEVVHIEIKDRKVNKVTTKNGNEYVGDSYISDIHPCTLLKLTDETAFPRAYRMRLDDIPNSYSCFSVYIKLKPDSVPYVNHPCYYQWQDGIIWKMAERCDEQWPRGFMCITPPSKNQYKWASRMVVNCIMSFDEVCKWSDTTIGHRGEEYERWKEEHRMKVLDKLETVYPGIKKCIEYSFASSPLTIRDYLGTKDGSMYGFSLDCKNLMLSMVPMYTKVRNLYLTGQNINLHGICGVPLTAIETADIILGKNVLIKKIIQIQ